jgi:hypothetical protein
MECTGQQIAQRVQRASVGRRRQELLQRLHLLRFAQDVHPKSEPPRERAAHCRRTLMILSSLPSRPCKKVRRDLFVLSRDFFACFSASSSAMRLHARALT